MSLIPNTVCRRCHREYPSLRSRCPYCGTKKPREVKRSLPESDSAVRGTEAARQAAENVNWQLVIGGILLLCVLIAVIAIISVSVSSHVDEPVSISEKETVPDIAAETTAVPIPTATPSPTPEPTPQVTSITITWLGQELVYNGIMDASGAQYDLDATPYPLMENVVVKWSSTDESVATVDQDGLVTLVGSSGGQCKISASAGGFETSIDIWVR